MLPRLEAQKELASINAMSIALGGASPFERQRYLGRLQRAAQGAEVARATPETLAAMGVAVVVVPPTEERADG
ncbi:hypothetical protein [Microcystis phage Mwe-Yong1]|nr:hypothetical protein [Microcystis phage Mwe-Yong1]